MNSVFRLSRQAGIICRHLGASQAGLRSRQEASKGTAQYEDNDTVDGLQLGLANEIHEQHEVPECGTFTAYKAGNVHVAFQDRTLLYMKASRQHCDVITPDGHRTTVATAAPLGVELYVAQAMEFADWAFSLPSERASVLQHVASIQRELGKCQRAVALCDWAQGQIPQAQDVAGGLEALCTDECEAGTVIPALHVADLMLYEQPRESGLSPAHREQIIQALLAKSSSLLKTI